jgi:SAM-dependent methyltransferase
MSRTLWDILKNIIRGKANIGFCPICEHRTLFVETKEWLRDNYLCVFCRSIPRNRALIRFIQKAYPDYTKFKIHESSPCGPASSKLQHVCPRYIATHYFLDVSPGNYKGDVRCENLECMTFESEVFDLIVTQDVLEHVLNPAKAFREIARTLKPGCAHVFTVPYYSGHETIIRAQETSEGIRFLKEKQFHGNPIDDAGSLVVTEWGDDLIEQIFRYSGMFTTVYCVVDRKLGLDGKFLEVFVSRKPNEQI